MTETTETRAPLDVATGFMTALDANDAEWVARCFAPGGTWWVDTGFDRAAGDFYTDPGADRPWPLHGLMDAAEKTAVLAGLPERFPGGCKQTLTRSFAGGDIAVLEVDGDGWFLGERHYTNRYCFLVEVRDGLVWAVREYLDTAHAAHVFEGQNLDRHTEAPEPTADVLTGRDDLTEAEKVAHRFLSALNNASPEDLFAACTPDASWWQDGGRIRTDGPAAPVAEDGGDCVLVGRAPISLRGLGIAKFKETYPDGFTVRAHRVTADDNFADTGLVAIEATSHGRRTGGLYQNRYAFVLRVEGRLIAEIREYCDTRHAFDVYGIDRL
jgi:ketosteroid isomerase-like protein